MHNELSIVYLLLVVLVGLCSFLLVGTNLSVMSGGAEKMSEAPEFFSF